MPQRYALTETFGAYYFRDVPEEDAVLTHVGPGTPGGEYLRCFWQPIAHSADLKDLPLPIRILGEDLVIFRDGHGRVGLLQRHCTHRGTSLEFGQIEDRGIRCCYHGWLYAVDGKILEMPNEFPDAPYTGKLCQGAYPTREYKGLVFAYMGAPKKIPPFAILDTFEMAGFELGLGEPIGIRNQKPCNWLQIMDNVMDPIHEAFLHARSSGYQFLDANGRPIAELSDVGELDFLETPNGMVCQETRRVGNDVWVRTLEYICPNIAQIARAPVLPPQYHGDSEELCLLPFITRWRVPIDDLNTLEFAFVRLRPGERNSYVMDPPPALRANYGGRPYEEMQRIPGDYEAQIGQRPIARHRLEHLGSTDRGVVMLRKLVRNGIEAVQGGLDPKGIFRNGNGVVPTYGNDTLIRLRSLPGRGEERDLLRRIARKVIERALKTPPMQAYKEVMI